MPLPPAKDEHAFYADSRQAWRRWLADNHDKAESIWLILHNKSSGVPTLTYAEAVEEALCFGWIDSKPNKRDAQSRYQLFTRRKPKSAWSAINKERVARLTASGQIHEAGQCMIDLAQRTGTWEALDGIDEVPDDLTKALHADKQAWIYWEAFPPSTKRAIHGWIRQAKRAETRAARIAETVQKAAQNIRANQYVQPKSGGLGKK